MAGENGEGRRIVRGRVALGLLGALAGASSWYLAGRLPEILPDPQRHDDLFNIIGFYSFLKSMDIQLIGAYAIQNAFLDVWLAVIFGIIGFVLRRMDYPLAPLVVALVLGFSTEEALRQSLIMSDGSMMIFFQRPIATPIMIVAILLFLLPVFKIVYNRMRARKA